MSTANPPTMSPAGGNEPRSGLKPPQEEFAYRPISTMAVIVLLAALVTLTSFLNMYVIPVALVVLIVGVVVSIRLDRSRTEYAGQLLAKLAILVSMVAVFGAGTFHTVTYFALSREAREYGETYIKALLADDLEEAFRLRIGPQVRAYSNNDIKDIMLKYNKNFEAFKKEKVTQALRAGGPNSTIEYVESTPIDRMEGLDLIGIRYRIRMATEPPKTVEVALGILGGVSPAGDWEGRQWYIWGNESARDVTSDPPAAK